MTTGEITVKRTGEGEYINESSNERPYIKYECLWENRETEGFIISQPSLVEI
jgi:hypothetical protein